MDFHSPAIGSERFIGFLLSITFHFGGTWEGLLAEIDNRGWLKRGLREKRVQKTPPPACTAIKGSVIRAGRESLCSHVLLVAAQEVASCSVPAGAWLETDKKNGVPELSLLFWFCGTSWYQSRDF